MSLRHLSIFLLSTGIFALINCDISIPNKAVIRGPIIPIPPRKPAVTASLCGNQKCAPLERCPDGQYLVYADPDNNVCCNYCKNYASLRQYCSFNYPDTQYCSPILTCQPRYEDGPSTCTYPFENLYKVNCTKPSCPTYCSCPDGQYLVKADGITNCCDQCIQYSRLGEYCDNRQPCYSDLQCGRNKICRPSLQCSFAKCRSVPATCPDNTYFVARNGLDICCDYCQTYRAVGESCGDNLYCANGSYCEYTNNTCVAYPPLDCSATLCLDVLESDCIGGTIIQPDYINNCCAYCSRIYY